MTKIEKINNKIKYAAFGKTKVRTERKKRLTADKIEDNEEKAKRMLEIQRIKLEEEIKKISSLKIGRSAKVFKMRKLVEGPKNNSQVAHAVLDNKTGELVVSNSEIKRVTLEYCLEVLENNIPSKEVRELVEIKEEKHQFKDGKH